MAAYITSLLGILTLSAFASLFAEGISWLLIYRTEEYQRLKATIERTQKKLEKKKEVSSKVKGKDKKVDRFEESLKTANRDMAMTKFKSTFAVGFLLISLFAFLNSSYDGKVVAKLPFEPFSLVSGVTHRNIVGNDLTALRTNLQKILGFAPPRQPFGQTPAPFF